ncbi:hypothetical protein RJ641_000141 [Dillenia turbinata]|uniref:Uncharacterized protein n=1 Tax=Dillenia turbinata TaxID=194707 RepID=A0AAN8ZTW0_9MAGN
MVAISDDNEFHKTIKRFILTGLLGPNAQRRLRHNKETFLENCSSQLHDHAKKHPGRAINFRNIFQSGLFGIAMKQAVGRDPQSLYVQKLGSTVTRRELLEILATEPMEGAFEMDPKQES